MDFLPLPSLLPFNIFVFAQTPVCLQFMPPGCIFPNLAPSSFEGKGGLISQPHVEGSGSKREGFSLGTCDFTNSPCHCRFFF